MMRTQEEIEKGLNAAYLVKTRFLDHLYDPVGRQPRRRDLGVAFVIESVLRWVVGFIEWDELVHQLEEEVKDGN